MITKKILAELVIFRVGAMNPTMSIKIDERDIFAAADIVIPALIAMELKENMAKGSMEINGSWYTAFENVKVKFNKQRRESYISLPGRLVSLPGDRGLSLYPMQDQSSPYVITNNNSAGVFKELEAGSMTRTCYIEGNKVFFRSLDKRIKDMLVKMVAATGSYNENDVLPVPAVAEDKLFEALASKFKEQVSFKMKKTNDSNPNTI